MEKLKKIFLILIALSFNVSIVRAEECSTAETKQLRSEASQVKASYEKQTRILDPDEYGLPDGWEDGDYVEIRRDYFKIYITNLTENLYVTVYNSVTGETTTYTYQDSDNGTISFDWTNLRTIVNYTVTVYSSDKTGCPDTKLHVGDVKTPRLNEFAAENLCSEAGDFYLCQEYVTFDYVEYEVFEKKIYDYINGKIDENGEEKTEEENQENNFFAKNKIGFIIASGIVLVVGVATVIVVKKKRSKKNEEFE